MAMNESVLLYNFEKKDYWNKMKMVFLKMGIKIRKIEKEDYLQPIGALAKIKDIERREEIYEGDTFEKELMIMNGFTRQRLDELLLQLRKNDVPRIPLKAVVTDTNKYWTSLDLYKEIVQENAMISAREATKKEEK